MHKSNPYSVLLILAVMGNLISFGTNEAKLRLEWEDEYLSIYDSRLDSPIKVHYIEAFVRSGSNDQDWANSVIPHRTTMISRSDDGDSLHLRSELPYVTESYLTTFPSMNNVESQSDLAFPKPSVVIDHYISSDADEVKFRLTIQNLSDEDVDVLWGQPCIRVDDFTGRGLKWYQEDHYLDACFIFIDDILTTLDKTPRVAEGFYTPGQVYAPIEINRENLNPRPVSTAIPSIGLIGCHSKDGAMLLATAWQPYQELFQGIATCIHSDFRIAGLKPKQTKIMLGKIYIIENDVGELLRRYHRDFDE
jgi:hypothetical protein